MEPEDPFPASLLDRASHLRTDTERLLALWDSPDAQRVAVRDGAVALAATGDPVIGQVPRSVDLSPDGVRVLLGIDPDGRSWWLIRPAALTAEADVRWLGLRELGPRLSPLELDVLMTAVALESWHARHGFCPSCGRPTDVVSAGWVRRCSADGTEHYPRTDPAVIVLVIDDEDRALLGRQARWPSAWRSALAGFVEPGERAESAVRREVAEEVALTLDRVHYIGSQPWPFPGSLMLGFHAWASSTEVRVDGEEIAQAEWYSREQLAQASSSGIIQLPPGISIARSLIERWYGQPLPGSWLRG